MKMSDFFPLNEHFGADSFIFYAVTHLQVQHSFISLHEIIVARSSNSKKRYFFTLWNRRDFVSVRRESTALFK